MIDPFAIIAIVVSAAILPALAIVIFWIIRGVGREHRDQVQQRYKRPASIASSTISTSYASAEERHSHDDIEKAICPTTALLPPATNAPTKADHTYLPETFDEVFDNHHAANEPAVLLAMRRSLQQEIDLGFVSAETRMPL